MASEFDRLSEGLSDRYTIERELGAGGMATVYLARDLKHDREVAIKVLRPELSASIGVDRFLREIGIAAKLNHPHILPLFDSGQTDEFLFYVMPYVDGESLRDRLTRERQLPIDDALSITREVASALNYAHENGVIHRDIKPENILLSSGGAVVADFGIARAVSVAGGDQLTETGLALGTPAYMSPEQATAEEVDARSDIYGLGCVLFEMLGGEAPYPGSTAQAIMARKLGEPVPSVRVLRDTVPEHLDTIVQKAMAKTPVDRFQTASELAAALSVEPSAAAEPKFVPKGKTLNARLALTIAVLVAAVVCGWWAVSNLMSDTDEINSLAVLPLANFTGDPEKEHIVSGMHDALISSLSRISALQTVTSRQSVLLFRDTSLSTPEIASSLGVDAIVEGSVFSQGDSLRITVQLVHGSTDRHLWSNDYEGSLQNVFALQNEVTRAIASEIQTSLTPLEEARLSTARTVNADAHEAYLRGTFHINLFTQEGFERGLEFLQRSADLDRGNPLPYAAMSSAYAMSGLGHGNLPPSVAFPLAREAAMQALDLEESLPDAHAALGLVHLFHDWDWAGAQREIERAIELNPNSPTAHHYLALFLNTMRLHEDAIDAMLRARQLDPLSHLITGDVAIRYWVAGMPDEAIAAARRSLELNPDLPPSLFALGVAYRQKGMYAEAIQAHERAAELSPTTFQFALAETYADAGYEQSAIQILDDADNDVKIRAAWYVAAVHDALGATDQTIEWLEKAYANRDPWMVSLNWGIRYHDLQTDPRFQDLMSRMQFPER